MLKPATPSVQSLIDAPSPRPSSTVILAREAAGDPEIFMVRRHESLSFGAAHAFPGGVVEADDADVYPFCTGIEPALANSRLGVGNGGLDYYSAAIRELFEESGVLLADFRDLEDKLEIVRAGLNAATERWADFVRRNQLQLKCDCLHYIGHWVTPDMRPKRYSTRFFLAVLPRGQVATHCGGELTDSRWASARDLLASAKNGDVDLPYPTTRTLESVARHETLDALVEWARSRVEWGITSMIPAIIERNGEQVIVLPGDKDYPGAKS